MISGQSRLVFGRFQAVDLRICRAVGARFGVAASTVGKLVRQWRTEKLLKPHYDRCGRKRAITGKTEKALEKSLRECPDATLQERKDALGLTCSVKTVWVSLKRLKARFKKNRSGRQSRIEKTSLSKRADWFECQPGVDPE